MEVPCWFPYRVLTASVERPHRLAQRGLTKERKMHPAITEQLTVQRIRELKWRSAQPGYPVEARKSTWRGIVERARRRRWHARRQPPRAVVVPFARREA